LLRKTFHISDLGYEGIINYPLVSQIGKEKGKESENFGSTRCDRGSNQHTLRICSLRNSRGAKRRCDWICPDIDRNLSDSDSWGSSQQPCLDHKVTQAPAKAVNVMQLIQTRIGGNMAQRSHSRPEKKVVKGRFNPNRNRKPRNGHKTQLSSKKKG
jgi:hypothetical protein